ncbi:MAG: hypothetical protein F6J90_42080 [Moorea sp. SIOASIH]|uniref:hypothetical protein n=1 Tax=Moorena sp. SIOASIH TaxID=2607817 RepID=UPI0013BD8885|nr:hypothetical protein [Moorena sp. SIOASIH]NEO42559.1 hypothetical protein [Moorena sp. SIOASIH]
MVSIQRSVVSGQWSVVSGQWSVVNSQLSVGGQLKINLIWDNLIVRDVRELKVWEKAYYQHSAFE